MLFSIRHLPVQELSSTSSSGTGINQALNPTITPVPTSRLLHISSTTAAAPQERKQQQLGVRIGGGKIGYNILASMNMADEGDVDSATLCSDAATVDGGSGERKRGGSGSSQSSPPPASVGVGGGGGSGSSPIPEEVKQTAKSRHRRRERALSTVDSPNRSRKIGGGGSLGYSMDGVSGEHSIVSFGMNFNFDSTSSPSNSDSGEAAEKEGEGSEQGSNNDNEDNNNNNRAQNAGDVGAGEDTDMRKKNKKSKRREGKGNTTGESSHHRQCPENGNFKNGGSRGGEFGS